MLEKSSCVIHEFAGAGTRKTGTAVKRSTLAERSLAGHHRQHEGRCGRVPPNSPFEERCRTGASASEPNLARCTMTAAPRTARSSSAFRIDLEDPKAYVNRTIRGADTYPICTQPGTRRSAGRLSADHRSDHTASQPDYIRD